MQLLKLETWENLWPFYFNLSAVELFTYFDICNTSLNITWIHPSSSVVILRAYLNIQFVKLSNF
jgi:hypothetical protein